MMMRIFVFLVSVNVNIHCIPVANDLSDWQSQWQQQLELLSWTANQQQLFANGEHLANVELEATTTEAVTVSEESVACECSGDTDVLGYGHCGAPSPSGSLSWCYVPHNSNCSDIFTYNDKSVSREPCASSTDNDLEEENLIADVLEEEASGEAPEEIVTESLIVVTEVEEYFTEASVTVETTPAPVTVETTPAPVVTSETPECVCSSFQDKLGYGQCSAPVVSGGQPWCYVSDRLCEDTMVYNNMFISNLACRNII